MLPRAPNYFGLAPGAAAEICPWAILNLALVAGLACMADSFTSIILYLNHVNRRADAYRREMIERACRQWGQGRVREAQRAMEATKGRNQDQRKSASMSRIYGREM